MWIVDETNSELIIALDVKPDDIILLRPEDVGTHGYYVHDVTNGRRPGRRYMKHSGGNSSHENNQPMRRLIKGIPPKRPS